MKHLLLRLLFYAMIVFLVFRAGEGHIQVVGPSRPIVATVGDDIILPCHLEPAVDASDLRLEWARPDLTPGFVHVRANSREYVVHKQPSYRGRTSAPVDRLKLGDVSLTLSRVHVSDEGTYRCLLPSLGRVAFIQLVVGTVPSPVISSLSRRNSSEVVLQCESEGWYPEPEVVWLDGEGNLLPAGPTETVRGPDDLYTVSSRVTVEKRHSNSFTCRVQQKSINQTREAHFQITVLSRYVKCVMAPGLIAVVLCIIYIIGGFLPCFKPVTSDQRDPVSVEQVDLNFNAVVDPNGEAPGVRGPCREQQKERRGTRKHRTTAEGRGGVINKYQWDESAYGWRGGAQAS